MKFSNTTFNYANKRDVEICEAVSGEVHLIANPEFNECASVAFAIEKNGDLVLINHWDESVKNVPSVVKDEVEFRKVVNAVSKSNYMDQ